MTEQKKLFILDTNVLMHDPSALFKFKEHDIFLPMVVIEELDNGKKGLSDVARNARQASRFLDQIMTGKNTAEIDAGIEIQPHYKNQEKKHQKNCSGKCYFQTKSRIDALPDSLPGKTADNHILGVALSLIKELKEQPVVVVSKDINLRIKAAILGIQAEDYSSDQVLEDSDLLYSGQIELDKDFWSKNKDKIKSWQDKQGQVFYELNGELTKNWYSGQCLHIDNGDTFEAMVQSTTENKAIIRLATDFRHNNNQVWGINARNKEQNFALNMLMDPDIDFVTLLGTAGTGKTLLALAAGLSQVLDDKRYREIIITRVTIPVGEDIGFLPGTEEEKMTPWMGALMDNLDVLNETDDKNKWENEATNDLLAAKIRIHSLNFMRGRTFLNRYLIIDEAQNLTAKQMKTLITRAGPGTKIVCLGNLAQIDTPYLTETTSGLTYTVDRFKNWQYGGHITLLKGERSRLADFAASEL